MKKKINFNKEIIKEKVSKILTIIWRVLLIIILGFILVGYLYQCSNNINRSDYVKSLNNAERVERNNYQVPNDYTSYTSNSFLVLYTDEYVVNPNTQLIVDRRPDITSAFGFEFTYYYTIELDNDSFSLELYSETRFLNDQYPIGYYNTNNTPYPSLSNNVYYTNQYTYYFDYLPSDVDLIQLSFNVFNDVSTNYEVVHVNITPKLYSVVNSQYNLLYTAVPFQNLINCSSSSTGLAPYLDVPNSQYSILNWFVPSDYNFKPFSYSYDFGYDNGYNDGFEFGKEVGTEYGYVDGYDNGYRDGSNDSGLAENGFITLFNVILTAPFNIFNGLLNFELFGVNLFNVFSFVITAFIIIWIVKRFI